MSLYLETLKISKIVYLWPYQTFLKSFGPLFSKYKLPLSLEALKVWHVVSLNSYNTRNNLPSYEVASCHKNKCHHWSSSKKSHGYLLNANYPNNFILNLRNVWVLMFITLYILRPQLKWICFFYTQATYNNYFTSILLLVFLGWFWQLCDFFQISNIELFVINFSTIWFRNTKYQEQTHANWFVITIVIWIILI